MNKVVITGHGGAGLSGIMNMHAARAENATACLTDMERLKLAGYDEKDSVAIIDVAATHGVSVDLIMQAMVRTAQKQNVMDEKLQALALAADPGNVPGTPNRAQRRAAKRKGRHKGKAPRKP